MDPRFVVDAACARFGVADMCAGKTDQELYAAIAPFMRHASPQQLRAQLQQRLPAHLSLDAVLNPTMQSQLYHALKQWERRFSC